MSAILSAILSVAIRYSGCSHLPLPGGGKKEKPWTPAEIKSAVAWKDGFVVHAIKSPYRRGIDSKSFNVKNLPAGLNASCEEKPLGIMTPEEIALSDNNEHLSLAEEAKDNYEVKP